LTSAPTSTPATFKSVLLRTLGAVLASVALTAFGVARLKRVERPRFVPVESRLGGVIVLGRVALSGRTLGWSALCRGREVFSAVGTVGFLAVVEEPSGGSLTLTSRDGRRVVIRGSDCGTRR
jgi:hypothetical protein